MKEESHPVAKKAAKAKKSSRIITPKLGKLPSQCILQAVDDLTAVEKMKGYEINMGTWHEKDSIDETWDTEKNCYVEVEKKGAKCEVCFAGSVIAKAGNDPDKYLEPGNFPDATKRKLEALNMFREGEIGYGCGHMGFQLPDVLDNLSNVHMTEYDNDPKQFKKDMTQIANVLAAVGL